MTKKIKFNLMLDGQSVNSIESLRDNFNIDDIYEYFDKGILRRWLESRNFTEELQLVDLIPDDADEKLSAISLANIFRIDIDSNDFMLSCANLVYSVDRKRKLDSLRNKEQDVQSIVASHFELYKKLCDQMIDNKENFKYIKASVSKISKEYYHIFINNHIEFYENMIASCPLAIFSVLMDRKIRSHFIFDEKREIVTAKDRNGSWFHE